MMAHDREGERMPVPNDDGCFPFEVWKEGGLLKGFATLAEAKAVCDRGNHQSGNFEVRSNGLRVWPLKTSGA